MSNFRKFFNKNQSNVVQEYYANKLDESTISTKDHNYFAWKIYFKEDLKSDDITTLLKRTDAMKQYIKSNTDMFNLDEIRGKLHFTISFKELNNDVQIKDSWPTLAKDLIDNCKQCLGCIGLSMHQTVIEDMLKFTDDSLNYVNDLPTINVRLIDYKPVTRIKNLKLEHYNKLVTVYGTVIKASCKTLKCTTMVFKCSQCDGLMMVKQNSYKFTSPRKCLYTGCKKTSDFIPLLSSIHTKTIDQQHIKIQNLFGDNDVNNESVGISNSIDCSLTQDLVNSCSAGDDIVLTGLLKVKDKENTQSGTFSMYIEAISLVNLKDKTESFMSFTQEDYGAIREIHEQEDLLRVLIHSLCPSIYGHEVVKAALLLTIFGGNGNSHLRSNPHMLIVGDPGLGKSQMLKTCTDVVPRGIYVCGTSSTNTGLTVSVTKENSEYSLDSGALLLSDTGVCCIDEFDKMSLSQQDGLLEVMEQQSISLAKAGIVCTLSAKTKVIAAANPVKGHYDKSKTIQENLHISQGMLSRFDLIFLLLDQPNEQHDSFLSDHIISMRTGRSKTNSLRNLNFTNPTPSSTSSTSGDSLRERLKLKTDEMVTRITPNLLKKYILYAQKYVNPKLSQDAKDVLKKFYLNLRSNCKEGDSVPITIRMLESLKRLTEARAKLELREEATARDAMEVIDIMKCSKTIIVNDLQPDIKPIRNSSKKKQIDNVLETLRGRSKMKGNSIFNVRELKEICNDYGVDGTNTIDLFNNQGLLLMKGNDNFQFINC